MKESHVATNEPQKDTTEERLQSRLVLDPIKGCWLWTGTTISNGYGCMWYEGKPEYTHRVAAVIYLDFDLASGLHVLHQCDTPNCVNPSHLSTGTHRDNMLDAAAKGRLGKKKLDAGKVSRIRYELTTKHTPYRELALQYGVSTTAIGQIARGESWKDVEPAAPVAEEGGNR
jgi:hypothetical protein